MKKKDIRPIIGILMDYEANGSFSSRPYYALRSAYFEAISAAGGIPIALPYHPDATYEFLKLVDGIILPGGFYPFPVSFYGIAPDLVEPPHPRIAFELDFTTRILEQNIPVLGICAGMQVMAVALGAIIEPNVHTVRKTNINHLNQETAEKFAHWVSITPGTLLHQITGCTEMQVNTAHQEGVDLNESGNAKDGLVINAMAPDGVVEGLEFKHNSFALGVQWHPEFFLDPLNPHLALFEALIAYAIKAKK